MSLSPNLSADTPRLDHRTSQQRRDELARDIVNAALVKGRFVLKDGVESEYFIDKYLFEVRPSIVRRIATHLAHLLPASTQRLVAHEIGPLAVATAVSLETGLPLAIAHEDRDEGKGLRFSGELHPGDEAVVIEDVVSSGQRAGSVITSLHKRRVKVVGALAVIDREEGGTASIEGHGAHFQPLYRLRDLAI